LAEQAAYGSRCENCWATRSSSIAVVELVDKAKRTLSPGQWAVELRLAAGDTYSQEAIDHGTSADVLKKTGSAWRLTMTTGTGQMDRCWDTLAATYPARLRTRAMHTRFGRTLGVPADRTPSRLEVDWKKMGFASGKWWRQRAEKRPVSLSHG
jgi:hypothetical protein